MPFDFHLQIWKAGNISLYQFDFNSLCSISSDLGDVARPFKPREKNISRPLHFWGPPLFFIISNVCTNKNNRRCFYFIPSSIWKRDGFCLRFNHPRRSRGCLSRLRAVSLFLENPCKTGAARSVGVGTAQSRSQSRSHACFAFVPQFSRKRETTRGLLLVGWCDIFGQNFHRYPGETHRWKGRGCSLKILN